MNESKTKILPFCGITKKLKKLCQKRKKQTLEMIRYVGVRTKTHSYRVMIHCGRKKSNYTKEMSPQARNKPRAVQYEIIYFKTLESYITN